MNVAALLQDSPSEDRNSKRNNWTQQQTQPSPASQARPNPSSASSSEPSTPFHPQSSRRHAQHHQHSSAGPATPTISFHASPARPIQDRPPASSTGPNTISSSNFPGLTSSATTSAPSGAAGSPSASSVTAWGPPHPGSLSFSVSAHNMDREQDRERRIMSTTPTTTQTLVGPGTQGSVSGQFFSFFLYFTLDSHGFFFLMHVRLNKS